MTFLKGWPKANCVCGDGNHRLGRDGARRRRLLPADTPPVRREVRVGISRLTWLIWLAASALLLLYCALRDEAMLSVVQAVNIAAIVTTLILVRRSNRVCPHHAKAANAHTPST